MHGELLAAIDSSVDALSAMLSELTGKLELTSDTLAAMLDTAHGENGAFPEIRIDGPRSCRVSDASMATEADGTTDTHLLEIAMIRFASRGAGLDSTPPAARPSPRGAAVRDFAAPQTPTPRASSILACS
jgi:hypothetical protein